MLVPLLKNQNTVDAPREARLILAYATGLSAERLRLHEGDALESEALHLARNMAGRRRKGEPLSHIFGRRTFYGRDFFVDHRVLDPRPETECLIEDALRQGFDRLLDLGTGTGAIAITLLAENVSATGMATDLSSDALDVARRNARAHKVDDQLRLLQSDWFAGVREQFDLIVSNPPYIALEEMGDLDNTVSNYEPRMALTDEADGLTAYRQIAAEVMDHLRPAGRLIVEIGPTQGANVEKLFDAAGLKEIRIIPDLDGRDRVVSAKRP